MYVQVQQRLHPQDCYLPCNSDKMVSQIGRFGHILGKIFEGMRFVLCVCVETANKAPSSLPLNYLCNICIR